MQQPVRTLLQRLLASQQPSPLSCLITSHSTDEAAARCSAACSTSAPATQPARQPRRAQLTQAQTMVIQHASSAPPPPRRLFPDSSPLVVKYPFSIQYLKDREVVVHDLARRPLSVEALPGAAFNVPVRIDILHRVVRYLRAKWQQGTHKAKTRGEVSGGSRKPWPQKKTGQARQGSIRSPLWKGGAATFGPRPRSHAHRLPRNVQLLGLKCALSAKCNEGRMVVVDSLAAVHGGSAPMPVGARRLMPMLAAHVAAAAAGAPDAGTASGARVKAPRLPPTALVVDCGERADDGGRVLRVAAGMMSGVEVMALRELTVYHLLKFNVLVITKPALQALCQQLIDPPHRNRLPLKKAWWKRELAAFEKAAFELQAGAVLASPPASSAPLLSALSASNAPALTER